MSKKNKIINLFGNKTVVNTGVKYSELLEKFITPFANEFKHIEYYEDIFEFAINAWNFANMKIIMPSEEFNEATQFTQDDDIDMPFLNKMMDYKLAKFKEHTRFIIDFELTDKNTNPKLTVITQSEDDYLSEIINSVDNESSENDFEENYINRNAIVVKPLQPFIDWHNTIYPDSTIELSNFEEPNIYLINDDIDDIEAWLRKKFDKFFMMELEDWHLTKTEWPQKRNYKMFTLWFQVEASTMIYDLEKRPILKSD